MTSTRLLTGGQIGYGVRGCTIQNNKTGLNITKGKNSPQRRIQRPCMSKPTIWMVPSKSIPVDTNNIIKPPPPIPNNTPYPSKTFTDDCGGSLNKKQNYMLMANEIFCNQQPQTNYTWNDMLSVNSSKSELLSHESRKNKHHHYLTHKSHSCRHPKKNEIIGNSGQKPLTDRKVNLLIFNPHRTLQFLVSELKSHLRSPKSDEKNIHKILSEIQQTIKRLETSNSLTSDSISTSISTQENQIHQVNQKNSVNKTNNSSCQTDNNNLSICEIVNSIEPDNNNNSNNNNIQNEIQNSEIQIKMELFEIEIKKNYEKLTENCNILEKTCHSLHEEKIKISTELSKSLTEISTLKNQISMLQGALKDTANQEKSATQNLKEQYRILQDQLKTVQESLTKKETDELMTVENLRSKLKDSSARISALEQSGIDNKKMFVLTKLENEKLMIMEKYRSNQISSMQNNINDIHKFIRRELRDLQQYITNGNKKDACEVITQITSNKMAKLFEDTKKLQNPKLLKFPLRKSNTTLKTSSKSYQSMISNLKSSSKSIKHSNNKLENIITNNSPRSAGNNNNIVANSNEPILIKSLSARRNNIIVKRTIDAKNQNQPSETSETSSFSEEMKKNKKTYNKIDIKNEENEFISLDGDEDVNNDDIVISNGKNLKYSNLHKKSQEHYQHLTKDKNMKNYHTNKIESISIAATNTNKNNTKKNFQSTDCGGKFTTGAYNLFEKNLNSKKKIPTVTSHGLENGVSDVGDGIGSGIRSPLKPSAAIPINEKRKSLKKTHITTNNIEIPLPNLNITQSNRKNLHSDADDDDDKNEHNKIHHHSYRQIDSNNEFNKKKTQYHNLVKKSNEIYVVGDNSDAHDGCYLNDQNHLKNLDRYHSSGNGNNSNSIYRDKTTNNDDNNNNNHHSKNSNSNDNHNRTRSTDKNLNRYKDRKMSPSNNKHKRPQLVQWKKYYWSRIEENNDPQQQEPQNQPKQHQHQQQGHHQQQQDQQCDEVGGCGDCFTHATKPETQIPILQYTSNFDEFRSMLDDVIPCSNSNGGNVSNRNNNNKIDISSDLNNSTSFDLSQTEYTDV